MTEISRPWAGTTIGDAGPYTAPHWWDVWQSMMNSSGALSGVGNLGVLSNVSGLLAVSYTAPNTLHVAAGAAMIDGLFYRNDAVVSVNMASASAGNVRDDRLVVRKSFSGLTQTARVTLVPGSEAASPGPGTPPALVQDTTRQTYWDLPLARVSVTELGVITVTDERQMIYFNDMVKLNETIVGLGGATITWSGIPQTFRHLKILVRGRCMDVSAVSNQVFLQFNGDTGNNYNNNLAQISAVGGGYLYLTDIGVAAVMTGVPLPSNAAAVSPSDVGVGEITILDYAGATRKSVISHGWHFTTTFPCQLLSGGEWTGTSPITSIKLYADSDFDAHPEFEAGSVFTLYGMK